MTLGKSDILQRRPFIFDRCAAYADIGPSCWASTSAEAGTQMLYVVTLASLGGMASCDGDFRGEIRRKP